MAQILYFFFGLVGLKTLKKLILLPLAVILLGVILSFFYFVTSGLTTVYNTINNLISYTPSDDGFSSIVFAAANSLGVIDGFQNGLPFVFTSIIFVLIKFLYSYFLEALSFLFKLAKTFLE